jgi:glycosyltransferase involved in cell wall biosynthesis
MSKVSAIIPFYNASDTLARALKSIDQQTHEVSEIIVVDDASHESESRAAEGIIASSPKARLLRSSVNGGPSVARNLGVAAATGEFVAFLDADDQWFPQKIERCIAFLLDKDADFVGHNNIVAGQRHKATTDRLRWGDSPYIMQRFDLFLCTSQFAPSTVVFKRSLAAVRFDETIRRSEDYRLWGDLIFTGVPLWKLQSFLGARDEAHINGSGLSGSATKILEAHLQTIHHFRGKGFITEVEKWAMIAFLKLKFRRH